jgi:alkylation response protein AidB-like acyl-CoA dehydrogenase
LPRIARGETEFALGYTEPQAGSDLASLEIKAVENGDYYITNGQKVFNTACHYAEYHWLGVRTDSTAAKHRGISLFIVDLKSPGITIHPIYGMGGWRTNEVFYDNVRVPKKNLVGQLNRGFYHIAVALDLERGGPAGASLRHFEELASYVKQISALAKDPQVRQQLSQLAIDVEVTRLLAVRVACMRDSGIVPNYEAAVLKLFRSELDQRLANAGMQVLGLYGQLQTGSKQVPLGGEVEWRYRDSVVETIIAGTSEIQRNIIAMRGLGLPRG